MNARGALAARSRSWQQHGAGSDNVCARTEVVFGLARERVLVYGRTLRTGRLFPVLVPVLGLVRASPAPVSCEGGRVKFFFNNGGRKRLERLTLNERSGYMRAYDVYKLL